MTKILSLQTSNVLRLKAVYIEPQDPVVELVGANASGKTSILRTIEMGIGGKDYIPAVPVHEGADKGETTITLSNGWTIKRTFQTNGNSYLTLTSADGGTFKSPQAMLDSLGKIAFDPFAFIREPKQQAPVLRRMLGLDFTAHDAQHAKLYAERTAVNKRLVEMRGAVSQMPEYKDAPAAEVSSADILAAIEKAQLFNQTGVSLDAKMTQAVNESLAAMREHTQAAAQVKALEDQLATARVRLVAAENAKVTAKQGEDAAVAAVKAFTPMDVTPLKTQLQTVEQTNAKVRANAARAKAVAEGKAKAAESESLTKQLTDLDAKKAQALADAKFPVPGLGFKDDVVTYKGFALTEASTAEQQRVSIAIGAALNEKLRVMLIRDGSLLDDSSMAVLRTMARELDLQVWVEVVLREGDDTTGKIVVEDGTAGVMPEPEAPKKRKTKALPAPEASVKVEGREEAMTQALERHSATSAAQAAAIDCGF